MGRGANLHRGGERLRVHGDEIQGNAGRWQDWRGIYLPQVRYMLPRRHSRRHLGEGDTVGGPTGRARVARRVQVGHCEGSRAGGLFLQLW